MVRRPRSPLAPTEAPDIRSSDKSESNISPFTQGYDGEIESQKQAREWRNKLKQGHQRRSRQRKEAWDKYESDIAEYNKKKSEQEAEERCATRMHNSPYDKIREALEELKAVSHPNEEQEQLQDILRPTALRTHDGRTHSRLPARSASHRQENQSQRKPAFKRLGPSGSHNRESRRDHSQSNRVEQPRESRSRVPIQIAPRNYSY